MSHLISMKLLPGRNRYAFSLVTLVNLKFHSKKIMIWEHRPEFRHQHQQDSDVTKKHQPKKKLFPPPRYKPLIHYCVVGLGAHSHNVRLQITLKDKHHFQERHHGWGPICLMLDCHRSSLSFVILALGAREAKKRSTG